MFKLLKEIGIFLIFCIFIYFIGLVIALIAEELYKVSTIAGVLFLSAATIGLSVLIYKVVK